MSGKFIDIAGLTIAAIWCVALLQWFWFVRPIRLRSWLNFNLIGSALSIGLALVFASRAIAVVVGW